MFRLQHLEIIGEKIKDFLSVKDRYWIFLLICIVIYTICWSLISVGQLLTINEPVYDLGIAYERLWVIFNSQMNLGYITYNIFFDGIVFLFSPLSLLNSYIFLLVFQTLFIGCTSAFLFGIAKEYLKKSKTSFIVASSYLIFFPLAGVNYFSFHFQAFFAFFFIAAYYFYVKGNYKFSLILFILSGLTRYPYMVFPLLFSVIAIMEHHKNKKLSTIFTKPGKDRTFIFSILLLFVSVIFILVGYFMSSGISGIYADSHIIPSGNFATNLPIKLETLCLLFSPLLFIPLLSKRWIVFYLPFIALLFVSNNIFYEYPVLFQFQYSMLIIPFLYLGLIDGFLILTEATFCAKKTKKGIRFLKKSYGILLTAILVSIVFFAIVFQPYGPLNSYSPDNYKIATDLSFNTTEYCQLTKIVKLIPQNDTSVLFQNDLPEMLPRISNASYGFLIAGYTHFTNINNSIIDSNSFPLYLANGTLVNSKINFVLAYLKSDTLYTGNPSMSTFLIKLYGSGDYGIVAEDMGFILLERGFRGSPIYFEPLNETFHLSTQNTYLSDLFPNYNVILNNPQHGIYDSKYDPISLAPGTYNITFTISAKNLSQRSMIIYGLVSPIFHDFSYFNVSSEGTFYLEKSMTINLTAFNDFISFQLGQIGGNAMLTLDYLTIKQV